MNEQADASIDARIASLAQNCVCNNLRRTTRAITNYYDDMLRPTGLRASQVPLLVASYLAGPRTLNELAQFLALDRTTLTRNLKPLEEARLVDIVPGEDQRTRIVSLTEAGRSTLLGLLPLWEQAQAHVVVGMGAERFAALLDNLAIAQQQVPE